jgi:hypothetical protein
MCHFLFVFCMVGYENSHLDGLLWAHGHLYFYLEIASILSIESVISALKQSEVVFLCFMSLGAGTK